MSVIIADNGYGPSARPLDVGESGEISGGSSARHRASTEQIVPKVTDPYPFRCGEPGPAKTRPRIATYRTRGPRCMPRYFFDIQDDQIFVDDTGYEFADLGAARLYAERVIRELKDDGWHDPRIVMIVKDENEAILLSLPFVANSAD